MNTLHAFILGLVQGIGEFLPVSSSGHLKLTQTLFDLEEVPLLFDVTLHIATLLAVFIYFRKVLWRLICIFFRFVFRIEEPESDCTDSKIQNLAPSDKAGMSTIWMIILTTAITGCFGIFTKKLIDEDALSIKFTCAGFIVTALLLLFSAFIEKRRQHFLEYVNIKWYQAIFIGIAQGIGTLPGISRSGSTIAGAQLCGVDRAKAGDYSFIVSIPAILGAFALTIKDYLELETAPPMDIIPLAVSFVTAFVSGYFALALLMKLINKGKLEWFAAYLIPVGITGLLFL